MKEKSMYVVIDIQSGFKLEIFGPFYKKEANFFVKAYNEEYYRTPKIYKLNSRNTNNDIIASLIQYNTAVHEAVGKVLWPKKKKKAKK